MKRLTKPKPELQAALLSAPLRDENQLSLTIPVERTFMWTESTTAIQWLQTSDKLPEFVANQVAEFQELTTLDEYIFRTEIPAVAGRRGFSAHALSENHWLKSSLFFKTKGLFNCQWTFWKKWKGTSPYPTKFHQNSKNKKQRLLPEMSLTSHQLPSGRSIAWTRNFCASYMLRLLPKFACNRIKTGSITDPAELENAQQKLFSLVPDESFYLERKCLLKSSPISKTSKILKLAPSIGPIGLLRPKRRTQLPFFLHLEQNILCMLMLDMH